jgi:hypothetical protein
MNVTLRAKLTNSSLASPGPQASSFFYYITSLPSNGTILRDQSNGIVVVNKTASYKFTVSIPSNTYGKPLTSFNYVACLMSVNDLQNLSPSDLANFCSPEVTVYITVQENQKPVVGTQQALKCDGSSGYSSLGDFDVPESFTIEFWLSIASLRDQQAFITVSQFNGANFFEIGLFSQRLFLRFGRYELFSTLIY